MNGGAIGGNTYWFLKYYLPQIANSNTNVKNTNDKENQSCDNQRNQNKDVYESRLTAQYPSGQKIISTSQQNISGYPVGLPVARFGTLDLTWLTSVVGSHFVTKGIEAVLGDINQNSPAKLRTSSTTFERAKLKLEVAKKATGQDQIEYVKEAEQKFVEAAADFTLPYLKAECFKYAALSAKMAGRQQATINHYADLALQHYKQAQEHFDPNDDYSEAGDIVRAVGSAVKMPLWLPLLTIWTVADSLEIGSSKSRDKLGNVVDRLVSGKKGEKEAELSHIFNKFEKSDLVAVCNKLKK